MRLIFQILIILSKDIIKNMQKSMVRILKSHQPADIVIMGTTLIPSMTSFFDLTFGLNVSTAIAISFFVVPVAAFPFHLRSSRKGFQIMSRIMMINGGTIRLIAAFHPPGFETTMASYALLLAGSVLYIGFSGRDPPQEGMDEAVEHFAKLKLDIPFGIINLCGDTVDMTKLFSLAEKLRAGKYLFPFVMHFRVKKTRIRDRSRIKRSYSENFTQSEIEAGHFLEICYPNESSDVSIIGCSLTGFDFLICGHYIDSPERRMETSNELLSKLEGINFFKRHEVWIDAKNILSLNLNKERLKINGESGLLTSIQYHVRKRWDHHFESLKSLDRIDIDRILSANVAMAFDESPFHYIK